MKTKWHTLTVKVRASAELNAAQVRREVKTLINEQSNFLNCLDNGDDLFLKASAVKSQKRGAEMAAMFRSDDGLCEGVCK